MWDDEWGSEETYMYVIYLYIYTHYRTYIHISFKKPLSAEQHLPSLLPLVQDVGKGLAVGYLAALLKTSWELKRPTPQNAIPPQEMRPY